MTGNRFRGFIRFLPPINYITPLFSINYRQKEPSDEKIQIETWIIKSVDYGWKLIETNTPIVLVDNHLSTTTHTAQIKTRRRRTKYLATWTTDIKVLARYWNSDSKIRAYDSTSNTTVTTVIHSNRYNTYEHKTVKS